MKGTAALALSAVFANTVGAETGASVVQWSIERRTSPQPPRSLRKRARTFEEVITNERSRGGYFATCSVGTPAQNLILQLDTGSSDIWVPDSGAQVCHDKESNPRGCSFGTFNPSRSKSFKNVGQNKFSIKYVDGSHSKGHYFTDAFEIGGASVANVTMGLGVDTDIAYGLVGVGYALNEAIVAGTRSAAAAYPNLPLTMVRDGLINTVAYSLWLNDLDASTGNILFGGVDTEKYVGDLTRIQVYQEPRSGAFTSFLVALTSLHAVSPSGSDTLTSRQFPIPVVLDSGTTLSYLPNDLALQVWKEVGAIYAPDLGVAVLPCNMAKSKGYFSFGFAGPNGPRINVTMDELVVNMADGDPPLFVSGPYRGKQACGFGIQNFSGDPFLLGDTFLRSAYVVYDLANNEIGIAATDFNATDTKIVPFPSLSARIPNATIAPSQTQAAIRPSLTTPAFAAVSGFSDSVTATAVVSSGGGGGNRGATGTNGGSASSTPTDSKSAGTVAEPLGISKLAVLGVSLGLAMVGSGVFFLF